MIRLFRNLRRHAVADPSRIALRDGARMLTYGELLNTVEATAMHLRQSEFSALALLADNGIPWVLADLSILHANLPCVPVPLFFSSQQILHAIRDSGVDGLLTDQPQQLTALLAQAGIKAQPAGKLLGLHLLRLPGAARKLQQGTVKITYTSGTTGEPKGVCLSLAHMETVAASLLEASLASRHDCHLCLTPLSTLLENIGGVYVTLLAGACCCVPALQTVGLNGASGLDAGRMVQALYDFDASTAIFVPQMLQALVAMMVSGMPRPSHLRFLAVGGAPVSPQLLESAARLQLPVFEGYGLSECASVVALNTPGHNRPGTAGRPLPHLAIAFADDGEILVDGPGFLGYLGQEDAKRPWPTGDIGHLDADGYLHVTGRKKSMFITSLGRNVAPEWVERDLALHPVIAQVAVFGEGRPWNCAVIVAREARLAAIDAAVAQVNERLPDYARIGRWLVADAPFTTLNEQLTPNGRLRRQRILSAYLERIEDLYQEEIHAVL